MTIGEKVAEARRAYPNLAGPNGRVWSVPIGRNCRLELVPANEPADVEAPIKIVTLERVSSSDTDEDEACDDVATGAGLNSATLSKPFSACTKPSL